MEPIILIGIFVVVFIIGLIMMNHGSKFGLVMLIIGAIGFILTTIAGIYLEEQPNIVSDEPHKIYEIIPDEKGPDITAYLNTILSTSNYSLVVKDEDGIVEVYKPNVNQTKLIFDDTSYVKCYKATKSWWIFKSETDVIELHIPEDEVEYVK